MLVRWLLFETWIGELLLLCLERYSDLAVVRAGWLGMQRSGEPSTVGEMQ